MCLADWGTGGGGGRAYLNSGCVHHEVTSNFSMLNRVTTGGGGVRRSYCHTDILNGRPLQYSTIF